MDIEKLLNALDNENNTSVIQLNYGKISADKNSILQELKLPKEQLKVLLKQLKKYRHVDSLEDVSFGSYIRWISLNKDVIKLTNGGIICHMKTVKEDIHLVCKNAWGNLFELKMTENIIFQKLNDQELVILSALKYLDG
jgi:hypothetical protein